MTLTLAQVLGATGGIARNIVATEFSGVTTDGRTAAPGDLYVALRGARFDGHEFVAQAQARGARGALVERDVPGSGLTIVRVADGRRALGALARYLRRLCRVPVVAITGSNGKTTTKDLCAAILGAAAPVLKTEGNLNNDVGVPLTLLRLRPEHGAAVLELGMSAPGEIAYLATIAEPDVGLITNVGPAHLGPLGSIEAVARAKAELLASLPRSGTAIAPADEPLLAAELARSPAHRKLRFGERPDCDVRLLGASARAGGGWDLQAAIAGERLEATLPLPGRHNLRNALAACAAAHALGTGVGAMRLGLASVRPTGHRSRVVDWEGRTILDDCYNANPASMAAALDALAELRGAGRTVAVLGDMLELGPAEASLHVELGERAARSADLVICVGPRSAATAHAAAGLLGAGRVTHVAAAPDAAPEVRARTAPGDVVLFKASRGVRLEQALDALGVPAPEDSR